ncbi:MAG TPA: sigma-70 family RNA polymerase sigma factor [Acidobacteriaceae bacterium]|jgi:RNA polymerase sigma-70 factor (ECF subfamily)|nr:sigma-70 family RNA polymerase sigma factor [Acidobacteriaceae bacterium]
MALVEGCSLALSSIQSVRPEIDLAALAESYAALLFRVAHSVLRSRSEAEDVVQDVFVRVLERRRELATVRDLRTWLVRIAWNLAIDRTRRIRPEQMDAEFAAGLATRGVSADKVLEEARRLATVLREMERLPKAERHVLLLSAVDEMGTAEIAQVLGKSESAVRALLFRARERLRERLERSEDKRARSERKKAQSGGER